MYLALSIIVDEVNLKGRMIFVWLKHQNRKDSNLLASASQHYFGSVVNEDLTQFERLRLFSDSYYGQNKNINVLSMLFALRNQRYPQLTIDCHFLIRGHSFLPADRAFIRIEQDFGKRQTILLPVEYIKILKRHE